MWKTSLSVVLFLIIVAEIEAQSYFNSELEQESTFKDSRLILSEDTSNYPSLLSFKGNKSRASLHPLYETFFASQSDQSTVFRWGVGTQFNFKTGKFKLGGNFFHSQGEYANFRSNIISREKVLAGFGEVSGGEEFQNNYWDAFISYRPNKIFEFETGYGRKFIGNGYRSLMLSDQASPYPYLMIQTNFWKIKYTNLFSSQLNTFGQVGNSSRYQRKYTATHFLELELFNKLSIGLFESVIWQASEGNYERGIEPAYLNPVIFYRPIEFSVGSSDNVIIGLNLNYEFNDQFEIYAQVLLDEFLISEMRADVRQKLDPSNNIRSGWWGNKYGIQFGLNGNNPFGIKGLQTTLEYNLVRPYTYAHSSPTQAYTHFSAPLAHPLGANFEEGIFRMTYSRGQYRFNFMATASRGGISLLNENLGENPEITNSTRSRDYENVIGQGLAMRRYFVESSIARKLKFLWGGEISLGCTWQASVLGSNENLNRFLFVGLRTNVFRQSFDY